jgi:hypothetical protein
MRVSEAQLSDTAAMGRVMVEALTTNGPARGFYQVMGGIDIGERTYDEEGRLPSERVSTAGPTCAC